MRVTLVHTAVPGRARLHVQGLEGNRTLERQLETGLRKLSIFREASANVWTGNLLVRYDRGARLARVIDEIEQLLLRAKTGPPERAAQNPRADDWHLMPAEQVARRFESSSAGLSAALARDRLKRCGLNVLPAIRGRSRMDILLEQFQSLPVALLTGVSVVSLLTGGIVDAIAIMSVVALNAGVGYVSESRTERTIEALSKPLDRPIPVVREGRSDFIPAASVVPGDVLELRPGVVAAADARVIDSHGLSMNEAMLTGESAPVAKSTEALQGVGVALADRANMVYRGTIVTGGSGLTVVVATGARTEIGKIQALVGEASAPETPLQRQLTGLGRRLTWITGAACGLVLLIGLLHGQRFLQTLKSAVALGVAAVPEGFPALATTTLALGIERMRRGRVLVRRLEAVETLASVRVVCLDKTGTLTCNRMSVVELSLLGETYRFEAGKLFDRNGVVAARVRAPALERLAEVVALCNETAIAQDRNGSTLSGSSTENALIELALGLGVDVREMRRRHPLVELRYRTEKRLFMTTLHEARDGRLVAVKGSPKEVLALCRTALCGAAPMPLTRELRRSIEQENDRLTADGQRVLGVAYAYIPSGDGGAYPFDLRWIGLVGMVDPLRPGVLELLKAFYRAGINPVMITGDQKGTAAAIARKLDLGNGELRIVDSGELAQFATMPDLSLVPHVFARVTPAQKLQIVRALQGAGWVVAMTGDGVNDSPALRAADIGVAMGRGGSDAAREVAEIVLENDDLISLLPALQQGRTTYGNIRKAIRYLLATNMSEILVVLGASALRLGQPLAPAQLLWINLISDVFPALALGLDPPEPGAMRAPPRDPCEEIVASQDFKTLGREAALMSAGALGAYCYGLSRYGASDRARTVCFAGLVTAQLLHALASRSRRHTAFSATLPRNRILEIVLVASFALQTAAMFLAPVRRLLRIAPIGAADALVALAAGVLPFIVNEAVKTSKSGGGASTALKGQAEGSYERSATS
jgi:Ca2+-transporting ATPase